MPITEASRHHLHLSLSQTIGEEDDAVLMEHLPPVGWADVMTRRDGDHLEAVLRLEIEASEHRLHARISELQASFTKQLVAASSVMIGMVVAIVQLLR